MKPVVDRYAWITVRRKEDRDLVVYPTGQQTLVRFPWGTLWQTMRWHRRLLRQVLPMLHIMFNGMNGIHRPEAGIIGAAFDAGATVELICDGFHIHPSVVRMTAALFGSSFEFNFGFYALCGNAGRRI